MSLENLEEILPKHEALAYLYLVHNAPKKASDVATELKVARPIAYNALEQLIEKNLVIKHKAPGKPAVYNPQHPIFLQELLDQKERALLQQKTLFQNTLPELISNFHLRFGGIPGFRIFVGRKGLVELYEDILNEGKDIMLIRSLEDRKHPEATGLLTPQMKAQVEAGIHVRSIAPYSTWIPQNHDEWYKRYNITQRIVSPERLNSPAQILLYANKVSITSFGEIMVTTIIEDRLIKDTFVSIFEALWNASEADDVRYRKIVEETHTVKE